ncbi:MAG: hypothetical protein AAFX00_03120 [Pseudomonadota bacterium]
MTKVISRFFDSVAQARAARHELLYRQGLSHEIVSLFDSTKGLADALGALSVSSDAIDAYASRMPNGGAVLVVRAGYKPLGVAQITRDVAKKMGAVDLGDLAQEVEVKDPLPGNLPILYGHPRFFTSLPDPDRTDFHMANFPLPLIRRGRPFSRSLFRPHARMASWPIDLLLPGNVRYGRYPFDYLVPGHKFMAKFPFAHLVPGHKYMAKFPFGHLIPGHKYQANFPIGHLIPGHKYQAKFPFGHLVPGHPRMANWPFPLLINGKQRTNSLVPGQRFMAKFPFAHLIPGHKYQAKFPFAHIVPGHKYMARFPFGHIVPGHKYQANFPFGHLVPGHKRMADFPLPLIVDRDEETGRRNGRLGFSLSAQAGIPTIWRRKSGDSQKRAS